MVGLARWATDGAPRVEDVVLPVTDATLPRRSLGPGWDRCATTSSPGSQGRVVPEPMNVTTVGDLPRSHPAFSRSWPAHRPRPSGRAPGEPVSRRPATEAQLVEARGRHRGRPRQKWPPSLGRGVMPSTTAGHGGPPGTDDRREIHHRRVDRVGAGEPVEQVVSAPRVARSPRSA